MKTRVILSILALALLASSAAAYPKKPTNFYLGAGVSVPTGDLGDGWNLGFHGRAALGHTLASATPTPKIEILGEIEYHSFGLDDMGSNISGGTFSSIMFGGGFKILFVPANPTSAFFLTGTIGFASADVSSFAGYSFEGETKMYIAPGFGYESTSNFFVMVRVVNVFLSGSSATYLPLTFGVKL